MLVTAVLWCRLCSRAEPVSSCVAGTGGFSVGLALVVVTWAGAFSAGQALAAVTWVDGFPVGRALVVVTWAGDFPVGPVLVAVTWAGGFPAASLVAPVVSSRCGPLLVPVFAAGFVPVVVPGVGCKGAVFLSALVVGAGDGLPVSVVASGSILRVTILAGVFTGSGCTGVGAT